MACIDTNCILRLLLNDIPEQAQSVKQALKTHKSVQVADIAIVESVYVLEKVYKMPKGMIVDSINLLIANSAIKCNRQLFHKAIPAYVKHQNLSFVDSCLSVYAELNNAEPLLTFDQDLAKIMSDTRLL